MFEMRSIRDSWVEESGGDMSRSIAESARLESKDIVKVG